MKISHRLAYTAESDVTELGSEALRAVKMGNAGRPVGCPTGW